MGDLTRAQLRVEVIANLGDRTNLGSGTAGETTLNRALDRVQTRIARANLAGWSELKDSGLTSVTITDVPAADVYFVDLPDGLSKILSFAVLPTGNTRYTRITAMLRSQWDSLITQASTSTTAAIISHYVDEYISPTTRRVRWYPIPNASFGLWYLYLMKPTPFVDDDAVSDFEDKDDLIIAGTTQYMFNRYQAFEESEQWRKNFEGQKAEALKDDQNKPDEHALPRGISSVGGTGPVNPWLDPFVRSTR